MLDIHPRARLLQCWSPGDRPSWIPIPFIPALNLESMFFDKVRASVAFAVQQLDLTFPCEIEMGLVGTMDVSLAIVQDNIQPIRAAEIVLRQRLANSSDADVSAALLAFFNQVYDATGFARPDSLFGFPPGPPRA